MRWLGIVAAAAVAAGCYDSRFGQPGAEQAPWTPTEHIAALRERYAGETFEVTGDIVVEGVVTSDDTRGNFYRSLCIEEQGAAIEIMTGTDHLHNDYPRGCRVVLRLRQLAVGESRGVLQAGRMPAPGSGYATDYIGSQAALDRVLARCGGEVKEPEPALRTIGGLEPRMCGTLVRIEGCATSPKSSPRRNGPDTSASPMPKVGRYAPMCAPMPTSPKGRFRSERLRSRGFSSSTGRSTYSNCAMKTTADRCRKAARSGASARRAVGVLAAAGMLAAAGCDRATEPRPREEQPVRHTIAYLKSLCDGAESRLVTREITVRGFITANDRYGEFYKSIVLEDETGGITVAVDQTGTAAEFPFGYVATLHGAGLRLCAYGGKVGIGIGAGEQGAEGIPAEETGRYLTVEPPGEERHTARTVTIDGIGPGLVDTRVRIDGVRFVESGATWCDTDPETGRTVTTERTIVDEQGNTLAVRTLGSCSYAKEPLPEGRGSLYGVVDCFSGKYSLRVTNRDLLFP